MSRILVPVGEEVNGEVGKRFKEVFLCNYAGCINWSYPHGIQNRNHLVVVNEDTHFCSSACQEQAERWEKEKEKMAKEKKEKEEEKTRYHPARAT